MSELEEAPGVRETANRLRVAIGAFKRRVREVSAEGELSSPQLTALSRLDRLGSMTTAELARREQISPQAMGTTIASLENLGLVARSADAADARRSILSLITGIVFHTSVSDSGVHIIGWIMIGVSLVLVLISVLDRTLPGKTGS